MNRKGFLKSILALAIAPKAIALLPPPIVSRINPEWVNAPYEFEPSTYSASEIQEFVRRDCTRKVNEIVEGLKRNRGYLDLVPKDSSCLPRDLGA